MKCPKCGARARAIDSRMYKRGDVRRRRECEQCGLRFSTLESIVSFAEINITEELGGREKC